MEIMTRDDMMQLLKCSSATLWRRERKEVIPPAIRKPGMAPYWIRSEVEAALSRH